MTRYEIDEWMNEVVKASDRERNDVAYDVVKNLYYAFSKTVGDDIASDILYTLASSIIGSSGESELSYPVFDLLARAFGVRLSKKYRANRYFFYYIEILLICSNWCDDLDD